MTFLGSIHSFLQVGHNNIRKLEKQKHRFELITQALDELITQALDELITQALDELIFV